MNSIRLKSKVNSMADFDDPVLDELPWNCPGPVPLGEAIGLDWEPVGLLCAALGPSPVPGFGPELG
jgi:hypothetical protein